MISFSDLFEKANKFLFSQDGVFEQTNPIDWKSINLNELLKSSNQSITKIDSTSKVATIIGLKA